jgi:hypothetical protein
MRNMFEDAREFNQNINNWMVIKSPDMTDMFLGLNGFPDEYKPNIESSINRRNFGEVTESKYPPAKDKTVSTKPIDQALGNKDLVGVINTYLGGKSKRKTQKRKYKSKRKNISRKKKQSRRKGKKTKKK